MTPESTEPRPAARIDTALLNAIWHTLSVSLAEAKAAVPLIRDHLARDGYTIAPTEPPHVHAFAETGPDIWQCSCGVTVHKGNVVPTIAPTPGRVEIELSDAIEAAEIIEAHADERDNDPDGEMDYDTMDAIDLAQRLRSAAERGSVPDTDNEQGWRDLIDEGRTELRRRLATIAPTPGRVETIFDALNAIADFRTRMALRDTDEDYWIVSVASGAFAPVDMTYGQTEALEEIADLAKQIAAERAATGGA